MRVDSGAPKITINFFKKGRQRPQAARRYLTLKQVLVKILIYLPTKVFS